MYNFIFIYFKYFQFNKNRNIFFNTLKILYHHLIKFLNIKKISYKLNNIKNHKIKLIDPKY